jgi:hypothetical protein
MMSLTSARRWRSTSCLIAVPFDWSQAMSAVLGNEGRNAQAGSITDGDLTDKLTECLTAWLQLMSEVLGGAYSNEVSLGTQVLSIALTQEWDAGMASRQREEAVVAKAPLHDQVTLVR